MEGPYPNVSLDVLYPRPTPLPSVDDEIVEVDGRQVILVPRDNVLSIPGDWSRSFPSRCVDYAGVLRWLRDVLLGQDLFHILPFCIGFLNLRVLFRRAFIWRLDVSPTSEAMPRGKACLLRWDLN